MRLSLRNPDFTTSRRIAQAINGFTSANIASAGEDPAEFIDTKLSVSERKYGALPESWRKGFEPARTVRTGKPKFRLVLNEEVR